MLMLCFLSVRVRSAFDKILQPTVQSLPGCTVTTIISDFYSSAYPVQMFLVKSTDEKHDVLAQIGWDVVVANILSKERVHLSVRHKVL